MLKLHASVTFCKETPACFLILSAMASAWAAKASWLSMRARFFSRRKAYSSRFQFDTTRRANNKKVGGVVYQGQYSPRVDYWVDFERAEFGPFRLVVVAGRGMGLLSSRVREPAAYEYSYSIVFFF